MFRATISCLQASHTWIICANKLGLILGCRTAPARNVDVDDVKWTSGKLNSTAENLVNILIAFAIIILKDQMNKQAQAWSDLHQTWQPSQWLLKQNSTKLFNLINWTTFSGPIKWNTIIFWLNKLYQHLKDYLSHNMIPNLLPNSKD